MTNIILSLDTIINALFSKYEDRDYIFNVWSYIITLEMIPFHSRAREIHTHFMSCCVYFGF